MSSRDPVAALYTAFARRDLPAVLALADQEIVVAQTELLPWGGTYHGHEGLKAFTAALLDRVDSQVEVEEFVEAGDQVVAIGRTRGTVRGTGTAFDVRVAHVWTLRDGKAVLFEAYIDTPAMLRALGE
jgi:ketosteroid isomerase-like protein